MAFDELSLGPKDVADMLERLMPLPRDLRRPSTELIALAITYLRVMDKVDVPREAWDKAMDELEKEDV